MPAVILAAGCVLDSRGAGVVGNTVRKSVVYPYILCGCARDIEEYGVCDYLPRVCGGSVGNLIHCECSNKGCCVSRIIGTREIEPFLCRIVKICSVVYNCPIDNIIYRYGYGKTVLAR